MEPQVTDRPASMAPDRRLASQDLPTPRPARRRALTALAAACAAPWLAGCAEPLVPLRVGSIVFPGYELLFLARELGLLEERRVRLVEMSANTDVIRCLAVGQLEAAALTLDEVISARADGVDLRVIAVLDLSAGADVVMARPGIRSLDELAGKSIGAEEGATGAVMLGALLEAAGLKVAQVRKQAMQLPHSVEVYAAGKVDAIVTAEPWAGLLEAQGARRLFDSRSIPGRIVDVLTVTAAAAERHGDSLRHLVAAHLAALAQFRAAPQRHAAAMAQRLQIQPEEVPGAFRGLDMPDAAGNAEMLAPGGTLQSGARALQDVMLGMGLLSARQDLRSLLDPRFLPRA